MEELKALSREVQTINYELSVPKWEAHRERKWYLRGSKKKLRTACEVLDMLHQRVLRELNPNVRTKLTGELYAEELDNAERGAFDQVLTEGGV